MGPSMIMILLSLPEVARAAPEIAMAAGSDHACMLNGAGAVKCWGANLYGQLGLEDKSPRGGDPLHVGSNMASVKLGLNADDSDAPYHAVSIGLGKQHTCAVLNTGQTKCWGDGTKGQLGYGDKIRRGTKPDEGGMEALPVIDVGPGNTVKKVWGGGFHTCALLNDDKLKCWGDNRNGQLGYGDKMNMGDYEGTMGVNLPAVDLDGTVADVSLGTWHSCAVLSDGKLKCWGKAVALGYGDNKERGSEADTMGSDLPAIDLGTGRTALKVAAGDTHTCVLLDNKDVVCFGANDKCQLGNGNQFTIGDEAGEMGADLVKVDLGDSQVPVELSAGLKSNCVVFGGGAVKCWGANAEGQLGYGDTADRGCVAANMGMFLPAVDLGAEAEQVQTAGSHTCASVYSGSGAVKCWGNNYDGKLGTGSRDPSTVGTDSRDMGANLPTVVSIDLPITTKTMTSVTTATVTATTVTTATATATATTVTTATVTTVTVTTVTVTVTTATATETVDETAGFISSARSRSWGLLAPLVLAPLAAWARH